MDPISLILLIAVCTSALPSVPIQDDHSDPSDDIQFDVADITAQLDYPSTRVTLEAFKVRNRTRSDAPKWVSIGYPMIVKNVNNQIFDFAPEYIKVKIAVLDALQQQTLYQMAKNQYPNENVKLENILPLPLVQFGCTLTFYLNGSRYEFQGSVYDLRRSPFTLRFPVHEGSLKRSALEIRIQSHHPLILECELAASGKQEKINTLRITGEKLQRMDLADKILGPADEKFVTRKQLQQLSQEVRTNLHIETEYELENEDFSEEFMYKILESSHTRFEPLPMDEALAHLSKYGLQSNDRDLDPNNIKRELSDIFQVSTEGNKSHIVARRSNIGTSASNFEGVQRRQANSSNANRFLEMASSDIHYALKKSDDWKKDTSTVDDQLHDMNTHSQSGIKWEIEGTRIVPKSLDVARVTRISLRQHMSFSRIKKRITSEKYYRRYELSSEDSEVARQSTDPLVQMMAALERSLQGNISLITSQMNSTKDVLATEIDAKIDRTKAELISTKRSISLEIDSKINNTKSSVAQAIDDKISSTKGVISQEITNAKGSISQEINTKINEAKGAMGHETNNKINAAKTEINTQIQNVRNSMNEVREWSKYHQQAETKFGSHWNEIQNVKNDLNGLKNSLRSSTSSNPGGTCTHHTTPHDMGAHQYVHFLDRQDIRCPNGKVLTRFHLVNADPNVYYEFTCCSLI